MDGLRERIQSRLDELGKSPRAASIESGMSPTAIRDLFRRPDNSPTLETIRKLSIGLETTPEWLIFGRSDLGAFGGAPSVTPVDVQNGSAGRSDESSASEVRAKMVAADHGGRVEAGSFRSVDEFSDEPPAPVAVAQDREFPTAPLVVFDVGGDSMNDLKPRPILAGDRVICIPFPWLEDKLTLRDGMVVVVEQTSDDGRYRERSVKQLELYEDRREFHPRSTNRAHKPIVVPMFTARDPSEEDGRKVEIIALVRRIENDVPLS